MQRLLYDLSGYKKSSLYENSKIVLLVTAGYSHRQHETLAVMKKDDRL